MRKILFLIAAAAVVVSCAKPEKTIENLKAAATGETNASAKYAKFAEAAKADSLFNIAAMFEATSQAEAVHAKNHLAVLSGLGVEFTPVVEDIAVDSTLANLYTAKAGEDAEVQTMYPEFIVVAETEKADGAKNSFNWAMIAEGKHSAFYSDAIATLTTTGNDSALVGEWVVCPVCGDTYTASALGAACELCATPAEKFTKFTANK